jgi:hypothetical protein
MKVYIFVTLIVSILTVCHVGVKAIDSLICPTAGNTLRYIPDLAEEGLDPDEITYNIAQLIRRAGSSRSYHVRNPKNPAQTFIISSLAV